MSFRNKTEMGVNIAILAALGILLGSTLFALLVRPETESTSAGKVRSKRELNERIVNQEKDLKEAKFQIASQVWPLPVEEVGPKALQSITAFAQKQKLKLVAFRPQKPAEVNGLNQLPFLISIEGSYLGLMRFLKDLESPDLKMATSLVQITSSDANSDLVTATVGVAAYKQLETKPTNAQTQEKPDATKKEN